MENNVKGKNNSKGVIILLCIIIVILLALCVLFVTDTISLKNKQTSNEQTDNSITQVEDNNITNKKSDNDNQNKQEEKNISNDESTNKEAEYYNELSEFGKSDYNIIKDEYTTNYSFKLMTDGKININFKNNISNIGNAKDIILFSPPSPYSILYILTDNGDIYEYSTQNYDSGDLNATKIDKYSNIKQIIKYMTRKQNAGGCDYIVLIDENGKYQELDSFCV